MAYYTQRPDGLLEVETDDGRVVPTALDPSLLEMRGIGPKPPSPVMTEGTAGITTPGVSMGLPGSEGLGASPAFQQLVNAGAPRPDVPGVPYGPPKPPMPELPPSQSMSVAPEPGMSRAASAAPQRDLVSVRPDEVAQAPASGLSDVDQATKAFLAGELAPRGGGPVQRIPAHDERSSFSIKYKEVPPLSPEEQQAIEDAHFGQQTARLASSEQDEYNKSVQARLAAQNASQAQRELERTLRRKDAIEQEVGKRVHAIDSRIAKARALTEAGTARERVWKNKGAFGRVLATIGNFLGDFAAMASKTGINPAREQLEKEVKDEADREERLYNTEPDRSALQAYVQSWGTPQLARQEYELSLKTAMLTKLEAWARRADAANVPVQFREWLADQTAKGESDRIALHQAAAAEVTENFQHKPEKIVGGAAPRDPLKAMKRTAEFREAYLKATGQDIAKMKPSDQEAIYARSLRLPDGRMVFAPDSKRAQKAQSTVDAVAQIRQNLRDIREVMTKPGSEINFADQERLRVAVQSNKTVGKEAEDLGALSGPDLELIAPLAGEKALRRLDPRNPDVAILAGLEAAEKHYGRREGASLRGLYSDPTLKNPVQAAKPGSFKERE